VRILKRILIVLVVLFVASVVVGLLLPSSAHVQRSTTIAAPPAAVFAVVNSFKRFNEWSPWYELDPAARYVYSGPQQGVGARLEWSSDKPEVGSGSQEIIASEPDKRVRNKLDFGSQGTAESEFSIVPVDQGSEVTWSFDSQFGYDLLQRYFGLLFEKWIGADFEKGLAKLKTVVEQDAGAPAPQARLEIVVAEVAPVDIVSVEGTTSLDPNAIAQALADAYGKIGDFMQANGLEQSDAKVAITRFYDESGWGFEAAIPFKGTDEAKAKAKAANGAGVKVARSYAGKVVRATHLGPYTGLPDTYRQLEDYVAANKLEPNGQAWEQYVSDPQSTPPDQLRTEVFMPVKPQG
jgi:effector-binding domain-containing protein